MNGFIQATNIKYHKKVPKTPEIIKYEDSYVNKYPSLIYTKRPKQITFGVTSEYFLHIQKGLDKLPLLKIDTISKLPKCNSFKDELFYIMLSLYSCRTLYTNNALQCEPEKNRSLSDIYCVVKFYKPEITLEEICDTLCQLLVEAKISTLYCGTINNRVYYTRIFKYGTCDSNIRIKSNLDEFGLILTEIY